MNYKIVILDTFRLFGRSKLLWIFGAFFVMSDFVYRITTYSIGKHPINCIPYPLLLIAIYFSFIAKAGIIYSTNQIASDQNPTFSEAWNFCKTKATGSVSFYFVNIPLQIFSVLMVEIYIRSQTSGLLTWSIGMLVTFFLISLFTMSMCTITINNLETGPALWTGLLIVFNNFFPIMVLNIVHIILQLLAISSTGQAHSGFFAFVPFTVTMTLAYQIFIKKVSYPALSNTQPTA